MTLTDQMRDVVGAGIIERSTANEILDHFGLDALLAKFRFSVNFEGAEMFTGEVEAADEDDAHDRVLNTLDGNIVIRRKFCVSNVRNLSDDIEIDAWSSVIEEDLDDEYPDFTVEIDGEVD